MPRREQLNVDDSIISADRLPVFYKYRFTYPDDTDKPTQIAKANQLAAEIRARYCNHDDRMTVGVEHYTKGMVPAKPHCHIHFVSKASADTIRSHLRTKFEIIGRAQCCKAETLVVEDKFWRYPLKQQSGASSVYSRAYGFTDEEVKNMTDVAYACWRQAAEIAVRKEEARQERSSKDRLWSYLDTQSLDGVRDAMIKAYIYYADHEDSFNTTTVRGYVLMYLMKRGIVSAESLVDMGI